MKLSKQWLCDANRKWEIVDPRRIFEERSSKSSSDDIHLTPSQMYGVLPQSEYMEKNGTGVVLNLVGADNMKHVEVDDFIIHLRSFQGGIEHSQYRGKVSNAYCVLKPKMGIEPRFFRWVLKSDGYIQELNSTTNQLRDGQSIKFEQFSSIGLPLPSVNEQIAIADFLDDKCSLIDRILESKKKLQKLIIEERISQITGLVTGKKLKKESFIQKDVDDWILNIPNNWGLIPLKHLVSTANSGIWGEEPGVFNNDLPVATTAHLTRENEFKYEEMPIRSMTDLDVNYYLCKPGDLVVVKSSGSSDNIMSGKVCAVPNSSPQFVFSNFLMRLRPNHVEYSTYLQAFLSSNIGVERVKKMVSTTTYPNLKVEEYLNSLIPVPPLGEVKMLNRKLIEFNISYHQQMTLISDSILKLIEYKTSLISTAIVGKLNFSSSKGVV